MYLPDNIQQYLRGSGVLNVNEAAKKEGDLYVAVNVVDNQRRIISVDNQLIESMINQKRTAPISETRRGLLKG